MNNLPHDWADWTNGKPADIPWTPNNGQCACELHRRYEEAYGLTVNEYYRQHPEIQPEWMERCGNCENFQRQQAKRHVEPESAPRPTKRRVEVEPEIEPEQTKRVQEVKQVMCDPVEKQREADAWADWYWRNQPAEPNVIDEFMKALTIKALKLTASFTISAVCLFPAALAATVVLAWRHRVAIAHGVLTAADMIGGVILAPIELAHKLTTAPRRERYTVGNSHQLLLTGENAITDAARLLEMQPQEFIEIKFDKRPEPVAVRR